MFDRSVTRLKLKNNQELYQIYKPAQFNTLILRYCEEFVVLQFI